MLLIPELVMAITYIWAGYVQWEREKYEHAITRWIVAGFFVVLYFLSISIETARILSRYFFWLLAGIEILSYYIIKNIRRKQ